jgi:Zn-dependent M28 family amino/carboxypeptidase
MKAFVLITLFFSVTCLHAQHMADSIIKKESLQYTVSFLSADSLKGRLTGSQGVHQAALFIAEKFKTTGLTSYPGKHDFYDSFPLTHNRKKITGVNVVGYLPSQAGIDTTVIFSAHYDHIGQGDDLEYNKNFSSEDDIFNGANDNATGVAALLELATYYAHARNNQYNLLFIAFAGEEMGLIGSTAYVKKTDTKQIKAVINLEMLGRPANGNCFIVTLGNNKVKNYLNKALEKTRGTESGKFFASDTFYEDELKYRSDHYPFAHKIKQAFTIMASSPQDIYYHSVDDEVGTIDFNFLATATKNIAIACEYFLR